ncbi:MAG: hypothetical protein AB7E42_11230 [Anaerotignaceae bacterium]
MFKPTLQQAKELSKFKIIPVSTEIFSDIRTPIEVLQILKTVSRHCYMLESLESSDKWGRYTFLGFDPKMEITCTNGEVTITADTKTVIKNTAPHKYINQIIEDNHSPKMDYLPPFTGGLVGYFSYDYIKYSEPSLNLDAQDDEGFKDVDLMFFDKVIAFDNLKQKIIIIANAKTDNIEENYKTSVEEIKKIVNLISNENYIEPPKGKLKSNFRQLFTKEEYCNMVNKAKHYIKEGDIFQVVLSNRLLLRKITKCLFVLAQELLPTAFQKMNIKNA